MRKYLYISLFLFSFFSASAQHTPWRPGEMEVKVAFNDPAQAQIVGSLGLNGDIYNDHAWLYLTPTELLKLKQTGIPYTINVPDLNVRSASYGPAQVPTGYYTFDQIKAIADSLTANFPGICKKVVFGFTPQMKELAALKISDNVDVDENEAEILFDGGIHGDEVGGSQNVIQFARDLCLAYGTDNYITSLVNGREIWLYYCVNPFGREYMTRQNGNGVDINRDFGYAWGAEGDSQFPFSQPESRALRDCQYSNQFVCYTNYHSGTEIIAYPWSYRYSPVPDKPHTDNLAKIYSDSSGYQGLPYGQGSVMMYLIQGSTKDFNYGSLGSAAWSIEISLNKQPAADYVQYYYNINKPAMLALIEQTGYGIEGTVTDAVTGTPINARVWVEDNYPTYTDGDAGDFHKYMIPGEYNLRFTANGFITKRVNHVTVNAKQSTVVDVQLHPEKSQYGYRTPVSNIPFFDAQNPGDEGYSAACLGAPDQVNYSLGRDGYVIVDMLNPVINEPGPDITIFEGDASPESYKVYALTDMDSQWKMMGTGQGTTNFDLASTTLSEARFFVIKDNGNNPPNMNNGGFDFDAIKNLHAPVPDTLAHLSGKVTDYFSGLPLAGATVKIGDSTVHSNSGGYYAIDVQRGPQLVCAGKELYNSSCDTMPLPPAVEVSHDFSLDYNVGLIEPGSAGILSAIPNPFTNIFNIRFYNEVAGRVIISLNPVSGIAGITLKDGLYGQGEHSLSFNPLEESWGTLTPGIFILSVQTPTRRLIEKVIKVTAR